MHKNPMKFENPTRVKELDIKGSLEKAGLKKGQVVVDYGPGTGLFTIAAAALAKKVYALDMDPEMIKIIDQKVSAQNLDNVITRGVAPDALPLEDQSVDLFILVTVLHEIEEVPEFVANVKRVLKKGGKVLVIDFYKKVTPIGPPVSHRMSAYQASRHFFKEGITMDLQQDLGENLYLLVLEA